MYINNPSYRFNTFSIAVKQGDGLNIKSIKRPIREIIGELITVVTKVPRPML